VWLPPVPTVWIGTHRRSDAARFPVPNRAGREPRPPRRTATCPPRRPGLAPSPVPAPWLDQDLSPFVPPGAFWLLVGTEPTVVAPPALYAGHRLCRRLSCSLSHVPISYPTDLTAYGAPPPEQVVAHTNLYWQFQTAPHRP
jgi:hypothetical protein